MLNDNVLRVDEVKAGRLRIPMDGRRRSFKVLLAVHEWRLQPHLQEHLNTETTTANIHGVGQYAVGLVVVRVKLQFLCHLVSSATLPRSSLSPETPEIRQAKAKMGRLAEIFNHPDEILPLVRMHSFVILQISAPHSAPTPLLRLAC